MQISEIDDEFETSPKEQAESLNWIETSRQLCNGVAAVSAGLCAASIASSKPVPAFVTGVVAYAFDRAGKSLSKAAQGYENGPK